MHPHHPADAAVAIKGLPLRLAALRCGELQAQGLNVLRGDLPLPLAVLKRDALTHNIEWMQRYARAQGVDLAPHGKTTMSPELFRKQLDAGAWGITFANVFQLAVGVAAGVRRALIANQLLAAADLAELAALLKAQPQLRAVFLLDSMAQLALIEAWAGAQAKPPCFEVMLELGIAGGRTGVRGHDEALALAHAARASAAVRLVGVECYEGLSASGDSARDTACADALMARLGALAQDCDREGLFEADEVLVSAGGSALFDLVAARLRVPLARPVRALLRWGCYITHDHVPLQAFGAADAAALRLRRGPATCARSLGQCAEHARARPGALERRAARPFLRYRVAAAGVARAARRPLRERRRPGLEDQRPERPARLPSARPRCCRAGGRSHRPGHFAPLHHL